LQSLRQKEGDMNRRDLVKGLLSIGAISGMGWIERRRVIDGVAPLPSRFIIMPNNLILQWGTTTVDGIRFPLSMTVMTLQVAESRDDGTVPGIYGIRSTGAHCDTPGVPWLALGTTA
jgi:hypothetical protein